MSWPPARRDPSAMREGASSSAVGPGWSRQSPITSNVLLQAARTKSWGCQPYGTLVLAPGVRNCSQSCLCLSWVWKMNSSELKGIQKRPANSPSRPGHGRVLPKCGLHCPADQPALFLAFISGNFEILLTPPFAFPVVYERALVHFFQLLSFPQRQHCFSLAFVSKVCSASWILWLRLTDLK